MKKWFHRLVILGSLLFVGEIVWIIVKGFSAGLEILWALEFLFGLAIWSYETFRINQELKKRVR